MVSDDYMLVNLLILVSLLAVVIETVLRPIAKGCFNFINETPYSFDILLFDPDLKSF